jgi:hypothetical protein
VPFDSATINRLYPTHDDYVAKVTSASRAVVKAGFLLEADADRTIAKAKRSIWGRQLTCGPLCADVRQFPSNPSSMLLANQTEYLVIKDADRTILPIADEVTRLVAEGYTSSTPADARRQFTLAATRLDAYIAGTRRLEQQGNMPPETAALLTRQAETLKSKILEIAK